MGSCTLPLKHEGMFKSISIAMLVVAFSSLARIFGECSTIHFPPALFLLLLLPLLFPLPLLLLLLLRRRLLLPLLLLLLSEVEISSRTLIPLCMPGSVRSGSAS